MLNKTIMASAFLLCATAVNAENVPITGNVESKCSIFTNTSGVYGMPQNNILTTDPSAGGVEPVIRINVATGGNYVAKISTPVGFSSSPDLNEQEVWTGDVIVDQVSDPLMADYDTNKATYNNTHEYDLTVSGSTWFKIESTMEYGINKPLPGGTYVAMVTAECVAK